MTMRGETTLSLSNLQLNKTLTHLSKQLQTWPLENTVIHSIIKPSAAKQLYFLFPAVYLFILLLLGDGFSVTLWVRVAVPRKSGICGKASPITIPSLILEISKSQLIL